VTLNQGLVDEDDASLLPSTEQALLRRNAALRSLSALPADEPHVAYTALTLPDYH
jgi:hypothetical protein